MTLSNPKTKDAARGHWKGILITLGVDEKCLKNKHGACPVCGGKDRFRFDDKDGNGTYYCGQCIKPSGNGFDLLKALFGWSFEVAAAKVDSIIGNIPMDTTTMAVDPDVRPYLAELWRGSAPLRSGDPAWTYLERRCGDIRNLTDNLRFHPGIAHTPSGTTHPAMLSMMRPPGATKNVGIHRTFLTPDGRKADLDPVKMTLGKVSLVALGPVMPKMGFGEGIESSLCAAKIFGMPVWSGVSADGLSKIVPPDGVTEVVIFGDNDLSFRGHLAAYALANRLWLTKRFISIEVHIPPVPDSDWADVYAEKFGRAA